jgi:hypothetical protein
MTASGPFRPENPPRSLDVLCVTGGNWDNAGLLADDAFADE